MAGLIKELQRRNVIRVGLAYLVLSWLLLQVGDVLFEALRLGESAMTLLLAVVALGFIPTVIFSWVYELTPEGVKRESEIDRELSITAHTGRRLNIAIVVLLVASIGLFIWDRLVPRPESTTATAAPDAAAAPADLAPSIAVLPFADMSAEGDQAYFADGIAEELLNLLARIEGLKVAARTSSFKFRGKDQDISQIGRSLKVRTVLEGSVRKSGNKVRITAQLIDVEGGFHIWSDSYDRTLENIFAVQDEISAAIVDALKLELALGAGETSTSRTESGEAYDLYLRGRELAREPSKDDLLRAVRYFEQALTIDPNFAQAHGAIASAWIWLEDYGGVPSEEAFQRAEPAALKALELDPNRADALTAMGFLMDRKYDDSAAAREYFERALEANPSFVEAYTIYADVLLDLGEVERAVAVRQEAIARDPLSGFLKSRLVSEYISTGRDADAQALLAEIFEASPEDTYGMEELANLQFRQGRLAEAVRAYRFVHENRPGDPYSAANIAICYGLMEDWEKAREWVGAARARGPNNRWELQARRVLAGYEGDWDAMFRAGQLNLSRDGATWQGQASLGRADWEAARASFLRTLAQLRYRPGEPPNGNMLEAIAGLALSEHRLGLGSWSGHAEAAFAFARDTQHMSFYLQGWPSLHAGYLLAQLSAIDGDADATVEFMEVAESQNLIYPHFIGHDPFFEGVRDDPRLVAIADRMRARAHAERDALESAVGGQ